MSLLNDPESLAGDSQPPALGDDPANLIHVHRPDIAERVDVGNVLANELTECTRVNRHQNIAIASKPRVTAHLDAQIPQSLRTLLLLVANQLAVLLAPTTRCGTLLAPPTAACATRLCKRIDAESDAAVMAEIAVRAIRMRLRVLGLRGKRPRCQRISDVS